MEAADQMAVAAAIIIMAIKRQSKKPKHAHAGAKAAAHAGAKAAAHAGAKAAAHAGAKKAAAEIASVKRKKSWLAAVVAVEAAAGVIDEPNLTLYIKFGLIIMRWLDNQCFHVSTAHSRFFSSICKNLSSSYYYRCAPNW